MKSLLKVQSRSKRAWIFYRGLAVRKRGFVRVPAALIRVLSNTSLLTVSFQRHYICALKLLRNLTEKDKYDLPIDTAFLNAQNKWWFFIKAPYESNIRYFWWKMRLVAFSYNFYLEKAVLKLYLHFTFSFWMVIGFSVCKRNAVSFQYSREIWY